MNFEEMKKVVSMLSQSQGSYGRILAQLETLDDDEIEDIEIWLKDKNVKTPLDLILAIEG
jgi:hypothetical protein